MYNDRDLTEYPEMNSLTGIFSAGMSRIFCEKVVLNMLCGLITSFASNEAEIRKFDSHPVSGAVPTPLMKRTFLPWVAI